MRGLKSFDKPGGLPAWEPGLRTSLIAFLAACMAASSTPGAARDAPSSVEVRPEIPNADDAPIALLVDMASGQVLFEREPQRRFMPASITKVMTTFVAFEWMEEGRLFPEQVFSIRPETFRKWSRVGSTMYIPSGARISVDDLLHGITTVSANDGSVVLAEGAAGSVADWIEAMNAKAREIGLRDSHFSTPNGWMDEGRTFTSAQDLVTLATAMISRHPSKYRHFVGATEFTYNGIKQSNHDPISGIVPGADGIKTGFTNQAGFGFLGSAARDRRRLVMVVAGSPTGRARNKAARGLIEWGFQAFEQRTLFKRGARIADAKVQGGGIGSVGLRARGPVQIAVPRGANPGLSAQVRYNGPINAPVAQGEEVATLIISIDGKVLNNVPLVAETEVFEATSVQRLFNGLRGWLS